MTIIDVESTSDTKEQIRARMRAKYAALRENKNHQMLRRRIRLAVLVIFALFLRIGFHTKVVPMDDPNEILKYKEMMAERSWYEHPALLFVLCALIAPLALLSIVATEFPKAMNNFPLFIVKLANIYCLYLRGLFTVSILVDIIQAFLRSAPPVTLFSAVFNLCRGHDWIDPYIRTDRLSFPSYQATITAYTTCFTLMMVNKSFNSQLAQRPFSKFFLRFFIVSFAVSNAILISFSCYVAYLDSAASVELYYVSLLLGIASAIFEVQGAKHESSGGHYHVVFRNIPPNSPPQPQNEPKLKQEGTSMETIVYVVTECLRAYHQIMKQKQQPAAVKEEGDKEIV